MSSPSNTVMTTATRLRSRREGVSVRVLGPVEVVRGDGQRIALGPGSARLLAALAIRPNEVVSAEVLSDELWPGVPDRVARGRLHSAIWKLRTLLGSAGVDARRHVRWCAHGYRLDVAEEQLDWVRFRRLRLAGERALQRGAPGLAKSYLSAALGLWRGPEVLSGVDIGVDDLGFVAARHAGRERALRCLIDAEFDLGDYSRVANELEAQLGRDPLDESAARQLAVSYHCMGNPAQALATCRRYVEAAEEAGEMPSARVTELQTSILRRDPGIGRPSRRGYANTEQTGATFGRRAFLSAFWEPYDASPAGALPAELYLGVEERGGRIHDATECSLEASFSELRPALRAATELQEALGAAPLLRTGVHVLDETGPHGEGVADEFDGPPRARARLLGAAAREGQILVTGAPEQFLRDHLPEGSGLRPLGSHRLNTLTPPAPVFQLTVPSWASSRAAPRWFDECPVRNLAEEPFRLVGREEDVAEVTRRLSEERLVTLTGAPGSGKTRLAAHVATGLSYQYRDGAWFVGLQAVSQPDLVAATVVDALQVPRRGPPVDGLLRFLRQRHLLLLLVLDNCEHLLAECGELVDRLLPACPWVTVLATSREALRSHLEYAVHVPPLKPPPPAPADALLANPSVQLLCDRLGCGANRDEAQTIARICRAVEGLPLALVLAAARANELGTAALAGRLEDALGEGDGLELLSRTGADGDAHATLTGTMEWSYGLLDEREQLLFDSLAVFRSAFTVEDAAAVCVSDEPGSRRKVRTGIERLVRASIVTTDDADPGSRRFRLLQPVRDFASAKLATQPDRTALLGRRHAAHFLALAEDTEPRVRGAQDRATVDRLREYLPDLYAAIRWAISNGEPLAALRLAGSLWVFWLVQGRITEGRQMLSAALAADPTPSPERNRALIAHACLCWFSGDLDAARQGCRETLTDAAAIGDEWGWAWAANGLVAVDMFNADDESILLRGEEALPLFRRLGNTWDTALALQTLGGAAWHRGHHDRAEEAFFEAVQLLRSLGHPTLMESFALHGLMTAVLGNLEAGAAEVEQSIVSAYETGDLVALAGALCVRGAIARYGGHDEQARTSYRDGLRTAHEATEAWSMQWALDGLASLDHVGADVPCERVEASVQLLAAAENLAEVTGITLAPREREAHARDIQKARARLGQSRFDGAFARGAQLTPDDAIDLALSLDEP